MNRPLASDNAVLWRKYAEELELELAEYRPKDTGFALWGVRVLADKTVPPGEARICWEGLTLATIQNIERDLLDRAAKGDWNIIAKTVDRLYKALQRTRTDLYRDPTEIRIAPEDENG